jgi:hypothetical protein
MKLVHAGDLAAMINRSLLIVRVKSPFVEWANSLDDGPQASLDTYEPTAYLVDDVEDVDDLPRLETALWRRIFEHQLASWDRDPGNWPRHRNRLMFRQWFDLDLHAMVLDIGTGTIGSI